MPWFRTGLTDARLLWRTADNSKSSEILGQLSSKAGPAHPYVQALLDYYDTIGTLVGNYTPTIVKVPHPNDIVLRNEEWTRETVIKPPYNNAAENKSIFYADFTEPIEASGMPFVPGWYDVVELRFSPANTIAFGPGQSGLFGWPLFHHHLPSIVQVELPGYGGQLTDIESMKEEVGWEFAFSDDMTMTWDEYYAIYHDPQPGEFFERKRLHDDTFQFAFGYLQPTVDLGAYGMSGTKWFRFAPVSQVQPSEPDDHGLSILDLPFDGVKIPPMTKRVKFIVSLDIEQIISIYDNNTPADKTDDIVVLAREYWERFNLQVIQE